MDNKVILTNMENKTKTPLKKSKKNNKKKFITTKRPDIIIDLTPVLEGKETIQDTIAELNDDTQTVNTCIKDTVATESSTEEKRHKILKDGKWARVKKWFKNFFS